MKIARFHYLTQDVPDISHQELAQTACENGLRWIQLRVKNKPFDEWLQVAKDIKSICDRFQATLIINDNVDICKSVDAHGVHLGKQDIAVAEARKILGADKIIGGTANTPEDIISLQKAGADYIGLGPYRFTETKKNLSKTIGLEGYVQMLRAANTLNAVPVIAIGGVLPEDVELLLKTGVYGVAVSSAINLSDNRQEAIAHFLERFSSADRSRNH